MSTWMQEATRCHLNTLSRTLIAIVGVLVSPVLLAAQAGTVRGMVTDGSTGLPLPGASVHLEGSGRATLTGTSGRYVLINVAPATYTLVAERLGYSTARRERLSVPIDLARTVHLALQPEAIALGEIRVEADRTPLVHRGQTGSVDLVSKEQLRILPATDIVDVLELSTGFLRVPEYNTTLLTYNQMRRGQTSLRLRGGRSSQTVFQIDGIPVNNFVLGGPALDVTNKAIEQLAVFKGQIDVQSRTQRRTEVPSSTEKWSCARPHSVEGWETSMTPPATST